MKFDYGKEGLEFNIDQTWNVTIFPSIEQKVLEKPIEKIRESINNPIGSLPLKKIVKKKQNLNEVCIVVSDATRPVPSKLILEALIHELDLYGIKKDQITVLIATGLHRPSRSDEMERILGKKLKDVIKAIDHLADDKRSMINLGMTTNKTPILINKHYYNADLKIITGYVDPHFFFGFAGGRKSIVPGIVSTETIQHNHSAENIASPYARFGIYQENPLHKNAIEISKKVGVDFMINVCINEHHKIVQVASGDFEKAHENLVEYQLTHIFKMIKEPFDIVVCGNGGYPLDLNLYQAVKSMAIGEMGVKKGGMIISVNECADGIGIGQENFKELIFSGMTPKEIHDNIIRKKIVVPDQWEIQILVRVLMKANIYIISKLTKDKIGNIGLKYAESIEQAIKIGINKHGTDAKILILPNGPQVLPLLKK